MNRNHDVLVKVENVSKKFCRNFKKSLWYGLTDILINRGLDRNHTLRDEEFWAVDNISFEVRRGECIGLLGHNGAGKSTLLKMLNGLYKPDGGKIEMHGRIGALIELGAGFNPILSGRENIYINGSILGLLRSEINQKINEIISFAELEEFIDMPVQNYSSGMKVRLGFAIAAHLKPDVFLIDEVLAVGDMGFVLKCFNRIDSLLPDTAVIFVSHNMPQVARICSKILVMQKGKTKYLGESVADGINLYYSEFAGANQNVIKVSEDVELESVWVELDSGRKFFAGEDIEVPSYSGMKIYIKIKAQRQLFSPSIYLAICDKEQRYFAEVMNFPAGIMTGTLERNASKTFVCHMESLPFSPGLFSISVTIQELQRHIKNNLLRAHAALNFRIQGGFQGWTPVQFKPEWHIAEDE